jgi:hypothetical protein
VAASGPVLVTNCLPALTINEGCEAEAARKLLAPTSFNFCVTREKKRFVKEKPLSGRERNFNG